MCELRFHYVIKQQCQTFSAYSLVVCILHAALAGPIVPSDLSCPRHIVSQSTGHPSGDYMDSLLSKCYCCPSLANPTHHNHQQSSPRNIWLKFFCFIKGFRFPKVSIWQPFRPQLNVANPPRLALPSTKARRDDQISIFGGVAATVNGPTQMTDCDGSIWHRGKLAQFWFISTILKGCSLTHGVTSDSHES